MAVKNPVIDPDGVVEVSLSVPCDPGMHQWGDEETLHTWKRQLGSCVRTVRECQRCRAHLIVSDWATQQTGAIWVMPATDA